MPDTPVQTAQGEEFNVDTAEANIAATGSATPVTSAAVPPAPTEELIEYVTEGGKKVRETLEMVKRRAGMGYNYAQRAHALNEKEVNWNKERESFQQKMKELETWKEYDDYARQNPQWAEHVHAMWEQRAQQLEGQGAANPASPLNAELEAIKKEIGPIKDWFSQQKRAEADKSYATEVESIRKKYPDIDLDAADENGKTMEMAVIEHAQKNGINSFRLAFLDFNHDRLLKLREDKAREAVIKEQQEKRKAGIIGETDQPTKGVSHAKNLKSKSYDDLAREFMEESGIHVT